MGKERDNLADARLGSDKNRIKDEIHKSNLALEKEVKQREMLRTKLVKTDIQKKTAEKKLDKLRPTGTSSSSAAASSSGAGKFKLKARAKAIPRLKPLKEDEEERVIIKPSKQHLTYLDLNNDPYLINQIR